MTVWTFRMQAPISPQFDWRSREERTFLVDLVTRNEISDQWLTVDGPFINEFCIIFLVSLWHHIERQMIAFAALAGGDGKQMTLIEYSERKRNIQKLPSNEKWQRIDKCLHIEGLAEYKTLNVLRHLSNAYKHNVDAGPSKDLLKNLSLDENVDYADIATSEKVQGALAKLVGIPMNAGYCDVAEAFVELASSFLAAVGRDTAVAQIRRSALRGLLATRFE